MSAAATTTKNPLQPTFELVALSSAREGAEDGGGGGGGAGTGAGTGAGAGAGEEEDDGLGDERCGRCFFEGDRENSSSRAWVDSARSDRPKELNGATFTGLQLVNTMIGSGILSFPYVIAKAGLASTLLILATFASVVYVTSNCLLDVGAAVGLPTGGYSEVVEKALGLTWRWTADLANCLNCMGALMSYFNVIGSLGADLVSSDHVAVVDSYAGFMVVAVLLLSPMCFLREYGELTPISSASLASIVVTTAAVGFGRGVPNHHAIPFGPERWWSPLALLGNVAYSTNMQASVFEAYASMRASSRPLMRRSIGGAIGSGAALLISMGLAGLAAQGSARVTSNVLMAFDRRAALVKLLLALTVLHLMCYIPNDFIIARLFWFQFRGINILQVPTRTYVAVTAAMLLIPLAIMAAVPKRNVSGAFELVISLTGSIPTAIGTIIVPCLAARATFNPPPKKNQAAAHLPMGLINVALALGFFLLIFAPLVTIYDFSASCASDKGCASYAR